MPLHDNIAGQPPDTPFRPSAHPEISRFILLFFEDYFKETFHFAQIVKHFCNIPCLPARRDFPARQKAARRAIPAGPTQAVLF
jgi:hypothetical protein